MIRLIEQFFKAVFFVFFDFALQYDPQSLSCDLVIGDDGDLVVDETPATPLLLSVELDRRAAIDDELPQGRDVFLAQQTGRRGSVCDCVDPMFELIGSKCWLLDRAKETEQTRLLFEMWLKQAVQWVKRETGEEAKITVKWIRPQTLQWRVVVGDFSVSKTRRIN